MSVYPYTDEATMLLGMTTPIKSIRGKRQDCGSVSGKIKFTILSASMKHPSNPDNNTCTNHRNNKTIEIKASYTRLTKRIKEPSADDCTNNTHNNIHQHPLTGICFHNDRSDPSCNRAKNDPH